MHIVKYFKMSVNDLQHVTPFIITCLAGSVESSVPVMCDLLSIYAHLVRTSPDYMVLVAAVFQGPKSM